MEEKKENDIAISKKKSLFKNHKSSSSSSIFLDTTIASPEVKNMIKAVSIMLFTQLSEDKTLTKKSQKKVIYTIFQKKNTLKNTLNISIGRKLRTSKKSPPSMK